MAARRSVVDDLLDLGTRLSPRTCLIGAVLAAIGFRGVALLMGTSVAPRTVGDLGAVVIHGMVGTIAQLLGVVVPVALLFAALIAYLRQRQAGSLHQKAREGGADAVRQMSWSKFERLVGEAFRRRGFEVREAGNSAGDGGVDLVLAREGRTYLVQCKHWKVERVGVTVARELNGVVAARGAAGGFVVTSGSFTSEARAFAKSCPIELVDGAALTEMIGKAEEGGLAVVPSARATAVSCPKCGSEMVRRLAKRGAYAGKEFWGCSRYPECRGISSESVAG
jgi:restriction system protein